MRITSLGALTLAFGLCVTLAGIQTSPAAPSHAMKTKKPMAGGGSQIARGKAVAESNGCDSCHSATYGGKKGFSPSIRATGVTRKYTAATFTRLMHTGITDDGGHVRKPMPVYPKLAAKDSTALYAFLKSQK